MSKIEGIGPKISAALKKGGINTFKKLANASPTKLKSFLKGPGLASADPTSWPHQASLADAQRWTELAALQDVLHGGRGLKKQTAGSKGTYIEPSAVPTETRPYSVLSFPTLQEIREEESRREQELRIEYQRAEKAANAIEKIIRGKNANYGKVNSCFVGYRRKFGRVLSPLQWVIIVEVPFKVAEDRLEKTGLDVVPQEHQGVRVKVAEDRASYLVTRPAVSLSGGGNLDRTQVFPSDASDYDETELAGGLPCSMSESIDNIGTLGLCFLNDGVPTAIVNQHFAEKDDHAQQPPEDALNGSTAQEIGRVVKSERVNFGFGSQQPSIDAAIIELNLNGGRQPSFKLLDGPNTLFDFDMFFASERIPFWQNFPTDQRPKAIFKVGAATQFTDCAIEHTNHTVVVEGDTAVQTIRFFGDGTVAAEGDSASVVCSWISDGILVLGLLFAGNHDGSVGYACHFADVIREMELQIDDSQLRGVNDWDFVEAP